MCLCGFMSGARVRGLMLISEKVNVGECAD